MEKGNKDIFTYVTTLGWDGEGARQSFLNDGAFYRNCLAVFLKEPVFRVLLEGGRKSRLAQIFPAAHYLKGSSAVLGILPMSDILSRITEAFRGKTQETLEKEMAGVDGCLLWQTLDTEYRKLEEEVEGLQPKKAEF